MKNQIDPREIFIKGKIVCLKVLTRNDVLNSNWYGWFNDEEVCETLQKHYFPNTIESQLEFWEKHIQSAKDKIQLGICKSNNSEILGIISLNNIDFINQKCEFSIVIGEKSGRNVGLFLESSKLIFKHAFQTLNMNKIYGGSLSKDLIKIMCRSLGCQEEGILRQDVYKHGKFNDIYRYSLLKEEYNKKLKI